MVFKALRNCAIFLISFFIKQLVLIITIDRSVKSEPLDCPIEDIVMLKLTFVVKLAEEAT